MDRGHQYDISYWLQKGEALYRQGRYKEAVSYFRQAASRGYSTHQACAYLAYCHYKGLGVPVNHYAAFRWHRHLIAKKDGVANARQVYGSEFDRICALQVAHPQGDSSEFDDYLIGHVVLRSDTTYERVRFYADKVVVELAGLDSCYDNYYAIGMIINAYEFHNLPPNLDESFTRDYEFYSLRIKQGNVAKVTHVANGDIYTIVVPKEMRFDQIVTQVAILMESRKVTKKVAQKYLPLRIAELSKQTGLKYTKCTIKNIDDYSGYHLRSGEVILSPYVIKWSTKEIDALIIHELCHSLVTGHEQDFYDTLLKYGGEEIFEIDKNLPCLDIGLI